MITAAKSIIISNTISNGFPLQWNSVTFLTGFIIFHSLKKRCKSGFLGEIIDRLNDTECIFRLSISFLFDFDICRMESLKTSQHKIRLSRSCIYKLDCDAMGNALTLRMYPFDFQSLVYVVQRDR